MSAIQQAEGDQMPQTPAAAEVGRSHGDADDIEYLRCRNEDLREEVEGLRGVIKQKVVDQLHRICTENEELRQELQTTVSELAERQRQLDVIGATMKRFDGLLLAVRELAEQNRELSQTKSACANLQVENNALKAELLRVHESDEKRKDSEREAEQRCCALEGKADVAEARPRRCLNNRRKR